MSKFISDVPPGSVDEEIMNQQPTGAMAVYAFGALIFVAVVLAIIVL